MTLSANFFSPLCLLKIVRQKKPVRKALKK